MDQSHARVSAVTHGVMTSSDDLSVEAAARALGEDAFFQKPVSFQRFMALGDLIKALVCGHTQT
jgi:hypothetical protein